jgi:hypothetical protein
MLTSFLRQVLLPTEDVGEGDLEGDESDFQHDWRSTAFHWYGKLEDATWIGAWVGAAGSEEPTAAEFEASANRFELHGKAKEVNGPWSGQYQMEGQKFRDIEHNLFFDAASPRVVAKGPLLPLFTLARVYDAIIA